MIPTIQLIYGSMPKISNSRKVINEIQIDLTYDPEFYLFSNNLCYYYHWRSCDAIKEFFNKTFNCLKIKNNREISIFFNRSTLCLHNINTSEVINKLITDDFYDSFQVLLNNLKTK